MDPALLMETTALAISEHLAQTGNLPKAAQMLLALATRKAAPISIRTVMALGRFAYDVKSWHEAANLWQAVANAEPKNIEACLKFAHALFELRDPRASSWASKVRELARDPKVSPPVELDEILKLVYEQVCLHFLGGDVPGAQELLNLASLPGSYAGKAVADERDSGAELSDDAISHRIASAVAEWERSRPTLGYADEFVRIGGRRNSEMPLAGKKVVLVFRKYFLGSANSREHELALFFEQSAKSVGMETIFFAAEPFLNPTIVTPDQQYGELDRLLRLIISERPDVVVFDDLGMPNGSGEHLSPEVYRRTLSELKAKHGFKLVGFYPDAWTEASMVTIRSVTEFADAAWHQNWALVDATKQANRGVMFLAPTPYLETLFESDETRKDIGAAFIGGLFEYNWPRAIWLTLLKSRQAPCEVFLANHTKAGSPAGATPAEYARFLSRVKITINFSARTSRRKILTGRAWEAILSKSLLLEEENDAIANYFVPFVHYIPYRTIRQLEAYLRFFLKHEDLRRQMTQRAYQWYLQNFSRERVWGDLMNLLFKETPPD